MAWIADRRAQEDEGNRDRKMEDRKMGPSSFSCPTSSCRLCSRLFSSCAGSPPSSGVRLDRGEQVGGGAWIRKKSLAPSGLEGMLVAVLPGRCPSLTSSRPVRGWERKAKSIPPQEGPPSPRLRVSVSSPPSPLREAGWLSLRSSLPAARASRPRSALFPALLFQKRKKVSRTHLFWSSTPCATAVRALFAEHPVVIILPWRARQSAQSLFGGPVRTNRPCCTRWKSACWSGLKT